MQAAEKIRILRKSKGLTQDAFAAAIYTNVSKIGQVESGNAEYTDRQLAIIGKLFHIEDMPLSQEECAAFKNKLFIWRRHIMDRELVKAKAMQKDMSKIINLELCDSDLPVLYRIFEVVLQFAENDFAAALESIEYIDKNFNMTPEQQFYHYRNKGFMYVHNSQREEALEFYHQALDLAETAKDFLPKDIPMLYCNIGFCYTVLGYPVRAILYLGKARELHKCKDETDRLSLILDWMLAINCVITNQLNEANALLSGSYERAKSLDDEYSLGNIIYIHGFLNMQEKNWREALEWFDRACEFFNKGTDDHIHANYHKIRCMVSARRFAKASEMLREAQHLYNESSKYKAHYDALWHYNEVSRRITMYNEASANYLENVAIPYLMSTNNHLMAMEYYQLLEAYYEHKSVKKSLIMAQGTRMIYQRCFANTEIPQKI